MAVQHEPGEPKHHATLGRAHLAMQALAPARAAFEAVLHLDEENLDAMLGLGRVLVQQSEGDTAARLYAALVPVYRRSEPREPVLRADFAELDAMFRHSP